MLGILRKMLEGVYDEKIGRKIKKNEDLEGQNEALKARRNNLVDEINRLEDKLEKLQDEEETKVNSDYYFDAFGNKIPKDYVGLKKALKIIDRIDEEIRKEYEDELWDTSLMYDEGKREDIYRGFRALSVIRMSVQREYESSARFMDKDIIGNQTYDNE